MKSIFEYLISKNNNKVNVRPIQGCTIEEIVTWLESLGVTDFHEEKPKNMQMRIDPKKGCLTCQFFEDDFVELVGNPKGHTIIQVVVVHPHGKNFFYNDLESDTHYMSFDEAIEIMEEMAIDPNKVIKL